MINLDCHPKIMTVGHTIDLSAKLPVEVAIAGKPRVVLHPFEGNPKGNAWELPCDSVNYESGHLCLTLCLPSEEEYLVRVFPQTGKLPLAECRIYGVEADLGSLRPLKGDFHMHSMRSDGKEPPAQVAVACRRIGLDFMALTDHGQYQPSLEAASPFAELPLEFSILPGEEVHPPDNPVHMINFGGHASVNELFKNSAYPIEVADIAAKLTGFEGEDLRMQYASCLWCYDKVREFGGLGIFCHPYWITGGRFNVCEAIMARHFKDRPFDAYEVFGGYGLDEYEANTLQATRYHEERLRDPGLPIVGVSDSHGCDPGYLFGWYYTLLFAASTGLADISAAVRELRAVAVAALPGRPPEVVGPFRLVKLALFLMREYLPSHERLCLKQAEALADYLAGRKGSKGRIAAVQDELDEYRRRLWRGASTVAASEERK